MRDRVADWWAPIAGMSIAGGLMAIAASVVLVSCRLAGSAPTDTASPVATASVSAAPAGTGGPAPSVLAAQAPKECGFPPGTALEFAGRATTAGLGVQQVVGDPMSDDPADIYVTAEPIDYGGVPGRVVCAIYVNDPGFVEITMHPDDVGRFTPLPTPTLPPGASEADAIEAARAVLPEPDEWQIEVTPPGPIANLLSEWTDYEWGRGLPADHWIWPISAERDDEGVAIIVDYVDGTVLGTLEYLLPSPGEL
ncbi:MAG TPA: hypothetical protein VFW95_11270 [Candidatus Limnocylindria bacterium]|nr:hypothetical protein [Candidatus Limnocylindria bacterium]